MQDKVIIALVTAGGAIIAAIIAAITLCCTKYIPHARKEDLEGQNLDDNWVEVQKGAYKLYNKKVHLSCEINTGEIMKKRTHEWEPWCKDVNDLMERGSSLGERHEKAQKLMWKHLETCVPYNSRAEVSRKMQDLAQKLGEHENKMSIDKAIDKEPTSMKTNQIEKKEELSWLSENVNNLMDQLTRENAPQRIGIYGEPGVGKTTIMRHLEDKAKKSCLFNSVIFVCFEEKDAPQSLTSTILKHLPSPSKKKYLLLLDQVTQEINLEKLKIFKDCKDWKMVIATRYKSVLRKMELEEHSFEINKLPEDDAAKLFMEIAESKDIDYETAKDIVTKYCGGMPQVIKTLATLLRGEVHWEQVKRDLDQPSKITYGNYGDDFYNVVKTVYGKLNNCTKSCFRYGALFPEDQEIYEKCLVECWLAERLISNSGTATKMKCVQDRQIFQKAFREGHVIIKNLLDAGLLVKGAKSSCVTMPHIFRNCALKIEHERSVLVGSRESFLQNDVKVLLESSNTATVAANWISLMDSNIALLEQVDSKLISSLFLWSDKIEELTKIMNSKFVPESSLRVLDLSYTGIEHLPPSVGELTDLRALYLNNCHKLVELPPEIRKLKNMEILDTCRSGIHFLHNNMEHLKGLRCLRVSFHYDENQTQTEPTSMIAGFKLLEEMTIILDKDQWQLWNNTLGKITRELARLKGFTTLCFYLPNLDRLATFMQCSMLWNNGHNQWGEKTFRTKLFLGSFEKRHEIEMSEYKVKQRLKIFGQSPFYKDSSNAITKVLKEGVEFINHGAIQHLSEFGMDNIAKLKVCVINDCKQMKSIISRKDYKNMNSNTAPLSSLNQLHLINLENLTSLFECTMAEESLSNLTTLTIFNCQRLKAVLSIDMILQIPCLKRLRVESCPDMIVIIRRSNKFEWITKKELLFHLESLELIDLKKLESIGEDILLECPSLTAIEVDKCLMLKTLSLGGKERKRITLICKEDWFNSLAPEIRCQCHTSFFSPLGVFKEEENYIREQDKEEPPKRKNDISTIEVSQGRRSKDDDGIAENASSSDQVQKDQGRKFVMVQKEPKMRFSFEVDMSALMVEILEEINSKLQHQYELIAGLLAQNGHRQDHTQQAWAGPSSGQGNADAKNLSNSHDNIASKEGACDHADPFVMDHLNENEKKVIRYAFSSTSGLDESETLVSAFDMHLRRDDISALKPQEWLEDSIICYQAAKLTSACKDKNNWYLPTSFANSILKSGVEDFKYFVEKEKLQEQFMPSSSTLDKIFIPIHIPGHFYLCMVRIKDKKAEIWDSLSSKGEKKERRDQVKRILKYLDELEVQADDKLSSFSISETNNIPKQNNGYDCGLFVIKYMKEGDDLIDKKDEFDSNKERLQMALELLTDTDNEKKGELEEKANEYWKSHVCKSSS